MPWRLAPCALLLPVVLGSCASPNPDLYSLGLRPGPVQAGARRVVVVRSVGLPRYLERQEVVRAAGQARLRVAENDWWSEPLRTMMQRVLVADLAQRLPGAAVLADGGPVSAHPDAEVEVEVQRFERDTEGEVLGGPVVLDGYAAVTGPGRPRTLDRLRFSLPVGAAGTTKGQVDAMDDALGQVADVVALRLAP